MSPSTTNAKKTKKKTTQKTASKRKPKSDFATKLQEETAGVRLHLNRFGISRALNTNQIDRAAMAFNADGRMMTARKKILNSKAPEMMRVTKLLSRARKLWVGMSVPHPEDKIRLMRKESVEAFETEMNEIVKSLRDATEALDDKYKDLRREAMLDLGDLFNPHDYPESIAHEYSIEWDYPNFEPPDYLKQLNPKAYAEEQQRIRRKFEDAVKLAEQSFAQEFADMVGHMIEKLTGEEDGKKKIFRNSSVDKLKEFFTRFEDLNIGSNEELSEAVEMAKKAIDGITPSEIRTDEDQRTKVSNALKEATEKIGLMMTERPKRRVQLDDDEE